MLEPPPAAPPLPSLQAQDPALAAGLRDALEGAGAAVVHGADVEDDAALLALVGHVATPTGLGNGDQLVFPVTPAPGKGDRSSRREAFELHTDSTFLPEPHDVIALACVRVPEDESGTSLVLHADDARRAVAAQAGEDALSTLAETAFPFVLKLPGAGDQVRLLPILREGPRGWEVRYRQDIISRLREAGVALDARPVRALEAWEAAVLPAATEFRLRPGDVLLADNRRVLHGRTAIGASADRLVKRIKAFTTA